MGTIRRCYVSKIRFFLLKNGLPKSAVMFKHAVKQLSVLTETRDCGLMVSAVVSRTKRTQVQIPFS